MQSLFNVDRNSGNCDTLLHYLTYFTDPRSRRQEIPKPPPYSKAPPLYHTINQTGAVTARNQRTVPVNAVIENVRHVETPPNDISSTSPNYNSSAASSPPSYELQRPINTVGETYRQNQPRNQGHAFVPTASPPAYVSVVRIETPRARARSPVSPVPGTSASFGTELQTCRKTVITTHNLSGINEEPRASRPSSISSGEISLVEELQRNVVLHRTLSERENSRQTPSPFVSTSLIRRTTSINIGIARSTSPVIITDHIVQGRQLRKNSKGSFKEKWRHPRPLVVQQSVADINNSCGNANINNDRTQGRSSVLKDRKYQNDIRDLLSTETSWPETPPLVSATAAARSSQRKVILERLKSRRTSQNENIV